MTASGCAANGKELHRFFDVSELGAFVTKSVMADPALRSRHTAHGRDPERACSTRSGCRDRGSTPSSATTSPWLKSVGARALVSIAGSSER